jgi:hypothetical protein
MKMKLDPEETLGIIAQYQEKLIDEKALSDWAVRNLEKGIESESLILLAGLTKSELLEASDLLKKAVPELGYSWPSEYLINLAYAKIIASQILSGEIQPNEGCNLIGEINHYLGWLDELSDFGSLAHNQSGHEHIGITRESVVPEIYSAAKELLKLELTL